ncbi:glycosyltransferase family 39 protein [Spirulina subsalsa FACHB-351]|uniref:Glycosyltransferase family 39 protein n=1 Tax=Spirulina subsalsa FACHB-351 TaxID=234711 RepID=A0ABT3L777_9CYAN|nr:glycosyltransferase family 39 protein [Spirulina subsalsa]MCW6036939.1 glycosyltransferase family 39 protein [Spirulina subsalsa FACHB-351]
MKSQVLSKIDYSLMLALGISLLLRIPTFLVPSWSVDEGFIAANATLILEGGVLYRDAVDHRAPLLTYLYSLIFALFGNYNTVAIYMALMLVIVTILILLYKTSQLFLNRVGVKCCIFLFASLSTTFTELSSDLYPFNTEWLMVALSLAGSYCLLKGLKPKQYFNYKLGLVSGVFFGLSLMTKQVALLDLLTSLCFVLAVPILNKNFSRLPILKSLTYALCIIIGSSLVLVLFWSFFAFNGAFNEFWFYVFTYNKNYYAIHSVTPTRLLGAITISLDKFLSDYGFYFLTFTACVLIIFSQLGKIKLHNSGANNFPVYWLMMLVSSFIAVTSPLRFFDHYYIQMIPSLCLLSALTMESIYDTFKNIQPCNTVQKKLISIYTVGFIVGLQGIPLLMNISHSLAGIKFWKQVHLSPESSRSRLISFIQQNSSKQDRIFVWGFASDIYLMSQRIPGSRFTYCTFVTGAIPGKNDWDLNTDQWIVPGSMNLLIDDLTETKPRLIIDTSPGDIMRWGRYPIEQYPELQNIIDNGYELAAEVKDVDNSRVIYRVYKLIN